MLLFHLAFLQLYMLIYRGSPLEFQFIECRRTDVMEVVVYRRALAKVFSGFFTPGNIVRIT